MCVVRCAQGPGSGLRCALCSGSRVLSALCVLLRVQPCVVRCAQGPDPARCGIPRYWGCAERFRHGRWPGMPVPPPRTSRRSSRSRSFSLPRPGAEFRRERRPATSDTDRDRARPAARRSPEARPLASASESHRDTRPEELLAPIIRLLPRSSATAREAPLDRRVRPRLSFSGSPRPPWRERRPATSDTDRDRARPAARPSPCGEPGEPLDRRVRRRL